MIIVLKQEAITEDVTRIEKLLKKKDYKFMFQKEKIKQ